MKPSGDEDVRPARKTTSSNAEALTDIVASPLTGSSPALFRTPDSTNDDPDEIDAVVSAKTFADYEIISEIARGGMGVVVRAREKKLNRIVALKMILGGNLADESDIKRFYIEAEAAAGLQHPGIVPIYEVGNVDGQHFYAMQLVEGPSLKERLANGPLPARVAAGLIQQVAVAVQYAHEHSIIHRDLKPENVLLTRDGKPMVTDFGLAKSIESGDNLTQSGQILGTPGYMAPEQALGRIDLQGPSVDIYSLGGLLYFLLTGRPPFQSASTLETLEQVVKQTPVSPRDLNSSVPRDLETICLKCLSKESRQRYYSASAFAEDLGRFLEGMPVVARPTGRVTRLIRWCIRNPAVAVLSAIVAVSLVAGTIVSTRFAFLAERRAIESEANFHESERQRLAAERNYHMARQAVDTYFTRVSEDRLLNQPGLQPLQKQLLQDALEYYQRFVADRSEDPSVREELASALFRVGLIEESVNADAEVGLKALKQACEIQEELVGQVGADEPVKEVLADTLTAISRIQLRSDRTDEALAAAERSLALRIEVLAGKTHDSEFRRLVASSYMNLGLVHRVRYGQAKAIQLIEEAQQIREEILAETSDFETRRDLGMGYYNLGNIALDLGDIPLALDSTERAVSAFLQTVDDAPEDIGNRSRLALCQRLRGDLLAETGDMPKAVISYKAATDGLRMLSKQNPEVSEYSVEFCVASMNLGSLLQDSLEVDAAIVALNESLTGFNRLYSDQASASLLSLLLDCKLRLAFANQDAGNIREVRELLNEIIIAASESLDSIPEIEDFLLEAKQLLATLDAPIG